MSPAAEPAPGAAPAHLFAKAAPCDRLAVFSGDVLRAALHNALARCQLADVQLCCERGATRKLRRASLEWRDEGEGQGMTALHIVVATDAPAAKKLALLDWLVAQQVALSTPDYVDCTPLHCAAALGDAAVVTRLLKAGASPRARDAEGLTPLHLAANGGHVAALVALCQNWAPVDCADFEEGEADTGSDDAQSFGASARLAAPGAQLYIARRGTALHVCCAAARQACAAQLLAAGADVNSPAGAQRSTPLHVAAREGHSPLLALLLDAGASIEARDEHGETALLRCVEGGHAGSVELLLSRGADARATSTRGLGTLHIAAALGHAHLFALLVAAGADVNAADGCEYEDADGRRTPLMYAAHYGCAAAFKQLLALGVDLRALSAAGWPALFYAVENSKPVVGRGGEANRHLEVIRIILERDRADCVWCTVQHGRTALMVAAMQDAAEAVRLLLEAQPWALAWRDARGRSAAHWAAVRGANDALEVLVAKGTDVRALDQDGKTPGDLLPPFDRTPVLRQWEAERRGAAGERRWDYNAVMEATTFRYMRKATAARRVREGAQERQCASCQRYSFDALRCGACRAAFYCGCECQRRDWTHGGHRLWCVPVPQSEGGQTLGAGREALEAMEKKPW